jgi:hypothetical protein
MIRADNSRLTIKTVCKLSGDTAGKYRRHSAFKKLSGAHFLSSTAASATVERGQIRSSVAENQNQFCTQRGKQ